MRAAMGQARGPLDQVSLRREYEGVMWGSSSFRVIPSRPDTTYAPLLPPEFQGECSAAGSGCDQSHDRDGHPQTQSHETLGIQGSCFSNGDGIFVGVEKARQDPEEHPETAGLMCH